jgi:hypothetical protein
VISRRQWVNFGQIEPVKVVTTVQIRNTKLIHFHRINLYFYYTRVRFHVKKNVFNQKSNSDRLQAIDLYLANRPSPLSPHGGGKDSGGIN